MVSRMTYAQDGEDLILNRFFSCDDGFFVEVGALDGIFLSNTYLLEHDRFWLGICVEPNPEVFGALLNNRRAFCYQAACVAPYQVGPAKLYLSQMPMLATTTKREEESIKRIHTNVELNWDGFREVDINGVTLDSILANHNPRKIDLISIDAEWTNADVLRGLDLKRWRPRVVVIEEGPDVCELMAEAGYHNARKVASNYFYVRDFKDVERMMEA